MFEREKYSFSFNLSQSLSVFLSIFFSHSFNLSISVSLSFSVPLNLPFSLPPFSFNINHKMESGPEATRLGKAERPGIMLRRKVTVSQEIRS